MMNYLSYLTYFVEVKLWHLLAGFLATLLLSSSATALYINITRPVCVAHPPEKVLLIPAPKPALPSPTLKPTHRWKMVPENNGRKF